MIDLNGDIPAQRQSIKSLMETLTKLDQALEAVERGHQLHAEAMAQGQYITDFEFLKNVLPAIPSESPVSTVGKNGTNAELFASIIEKHGKPMTLTAITNEALRLGVVFKSKSNNPPRTKVRSSLCASKRFDNIGDNTWWLADKPLPQLSGMGDDLFN